MITYIYYLIYIETMYFLKKLIKVICIGVLSFTLTSCGGGYYGGDYSNDYPYDDYQYDEPYYDDYQDYEPYYDDYQDYEPNYR